MKAKEHGLHEPVSIHPRVDPGICIGSTACIQACPEKDILGLVNKQASAVNASRCIGHGACVAACPVHAISLVFGSETRGVEIPHVSPTFETNVPGIYIVGELGGMGLIKNAIVQGREMVEYIVKNSLGKKQTRDRYDLLVVGAGPAGISASLTALKHKLNFVTIEQDDIGGSVTHYPRKKIVMTSPVELSMYGRMRLSKTTKESLLTFWSGVIKKTGLVVRTREKLTGLESEDRGFRVTTTRGEYHTRRVALAIGRRGTPRKLGIPGEDRSKVAYRLLDPEQHQNEDLLVVGGGDSAVEAAVALAGPMGNRVTLSYRKEVFSRIKPANQQRLNDAQLKGHLQVHLSSQAKEIGEKTVSLAFGGQIRQMPNDYVYVFAGGELPNEFLRKIGIRIEKKFGTA